MPAKLNSAQLRRQAGGHCLGQIVSAINVHICRSVVPGYVPGRSATYENQALAYEWYNRGVNALRGIMGNQGKIAKKQSSKIYVFGFIF